MVSSTTNVNQGVVLRNSNCLPNFFKGLAKYSRTFLHHLRQNTLKPRSMKISVFRWSSCGQGCRIGVVRSRRFLGGVRVGFLTTPEVEVGFFRPTLTPVVQLDHFLHHTPK